MKSGLHKAVDVRRYHIPLMNEQQKISKHAQNLMILGYRDYVGARFLLNNELLVQGVTLASTAVEKYLKVLLLVLGFKRKLHMEDWKEIKNLLTKNGIEIFSELDHNFIQLLSKVYKLRYYDKVQNQVNYSFIKWQVLAELDFTVGIIEERTSFKYSNDVTWESPYKMAVRTKDDKVFCENYYLNGLSKKEYMEREGKAIVVNIDQNLEEIVIEGPLKVQEYSGKILQLEGFEILPSQ
jgi:hypothetical protein